MGEAADAGGQAFAAEVARIRASGVLGESGRLRELFDFLAARGSAAEPASQAEIGEAVFGQHAADGDDATVRVYVHRLRRRLEDFYAAGGKGGQGRIIIPAGSYALRLAAEPDTETAVARHGQRRRAWLIALLAVPVLLAALAAGWFVRGAAAPAAAPANPVWRPFVESPRPIVVAVGDYYIFGEYDRDYPEVTRLVRDFSISDPTDLARAQEADPARYGRTEDMGLTYLPVSSAHALASLIPVFSRNTHPVSIVPASALTSATFRDSNVVYVGLVSGMRLLEDVTFMGSDFMVGDTYDELIDTRSGRRYASEEALNLPSARYYRDYGYFAMFREPGGALVAVVAGARDTALRALAPVVAGMQLPQRLEALARANPPRGYEALFEITGQQGADLKERLVAARARP